MIQKTETLQESVGATATPKLKKISPPSVNGLIASLMVETIVLFSRGVAWAKTSLKIVSPKILTVLICLAVILSPLTTWGAQKKITLKLGGQYCSSYLDDVKNALKKVPGVGKISFNSAQDRVVVVGDSPTLKEADLITAINKVKGDGWFCQAESVR